MEFLNNNVCSPKGFKALGKSIGIKKSGKADFAVIFSEVLADAAAVYTSNKVKGAPLIVTRNHLKDGKAQSIVINSGISNVCTGEKGIKDAEEVAKLSAAELGINADNVLVASTGVIGKFLPMGKISNGLKGIKDELSITPEVAKAIMTTDTVEKEIAVKADNFTIGAIAKGSGMISPNMATMLCFIGTDAEFQAKDLKQMLKNSVEEEAKAFAFEIAWMKAIREHNIGNLAGSIETGILSPANNGIHDVAFNFVRGLLKEKTALEAYWEIAAGFSNKFLN